MKCETLTDMTTFSLNCEVVYLNGAVSTVLYNKFGGSRNIYGLKLELLS